MGVQGPLLLLLLVVCVVLGKPGELRRFIHQTRGDRVCGKFCGPMKLTSHLYPGSGEESQAAGEEPWSP